MTTEPTAADTDLSNVPSAVETAAGIGEEAATTTPPGSDNEPEKEQEDKEAPESEADKAVADKTEQIAKAGETATSQTRARPRQKMTFAAAAANFASLAVEAGLEARLDARAAKAAKASAKAAGVEPAASTATPLAPAAQPVSRPLAEDVQQAAKAAARGPSASQQALTAKRVREANQANAAILAASALKHANTLEAKVAKHDETYRAHANLVNAKMEELQKSIPDAGKRRKQAMREAESLLPEFSDPLAKARYERSRKQIADSAARLSKDLKTLGGKKLDGEIDPKLRESLSALHEKVSDADNPFDKAARAATFDGQEDENWKEMMKRFAKEALEAIMAFFQKIFAAVGLAPKPGAKT